MTSIELERRAEEDEAAREHELLLLREELDVLDIDESLYRHCWTRVWGEFSYRFPSDVVMTFVRLAGMLERSATNGKQTTSERCGKVC